MSKRNFTLQERLVVYLILLGSLIIVAGFTGNNRAKHTGNGHPASSINTLSHQPKRIAYAGPNDDTDGDGVLDGTDVDDDNDGLTDLQESPTGLDPFGDANSNTVLNYQDNLMGGWSDANSDGIDDQYDMDRDGIINSYDLDMDGDGIPDVRETDLIDVDQDAKVDGAVGLDGWSTVVASMSPAHVPLDTDSDGLPNFRDIDSDADGITDNVEGQFTNYFVLPGGTDTDQDGIDNSYDSDNNLNFNHQGLIPVNFQGAVDTEPDYIDADTDDDGRSDIIEGHDANLNGVADYTPSGTDADGDGLDDAFDLDLTGPNVKNEGMNSIPSPPFFDSNPPSNPTGTLGARGPLQRTDAVNDLDRTWRDFDASLLPLTLVKFTAERQEGKILLNWQSANETNFREYILERSRDGVTFKAIANIPGKGGLQAFYSYADNLGMQAAAKLYYRLRQVDNNSRFVYSRILSVTPHKITGITMKVTPNPASENVTLSIASDKKRTVIIQVMDNLGRLLITQRTGIAHGDNIIPLSGANSLQNGLYTVVINAGDEKQSEKLLIQK